MFDLKNFYNNKRGVSMVHFILACMVVILFSFMAVPAYFGIKQERDALTMISNNGAAQEAGTKQAENVMTLDEIYELARDEEALNPEDLNAIMPAAGDDESGSFIGHFTGSMDPALDGGAVEAAPAIQE